MSSMLFKATGIWFVIVVAAILNGLFREKVLMPALGSTVALLLSGLLLAALVFLVTLVLISFIGSSEAKTYVGIGLLWVMLTLCFELLFGYFVADKSWQEIMQVFNMKTGDLFVIVLLVTAASPWISAKLRGLLRV